MLEQLQPAPPETGEIDVGREEGGVAIDCLRSDQGVGRGQGNALTRTEIHEVCREEMVALGGQDDGEAGAEGGEQSLMLDAIGDSAQDLLENDAGDPDRLLTMQQLRDTPAQVVFG